MKNTLFTSYFHLTQHSPMIHFQQEQEGATLRVSEVKPKLDRFIRKDLRRINPALLEKIQEVYKGDFFSSSHADRQKKPQESPYKMQLWAGTPKWYLPQAHKVKEEDVRNLGQKLGISISPLPYTAFFANEESVTKMEENWENIRLAAHFPNGVSGKIHSLFPGLSTLLLQCLEYVLVFENFGTRQSKGFGCFSLSNQIQVGYEKILRSDPLLTIRKKIYPKGISLDRMMATILKEYKKLKNDSGTKTSHIRDFYERQGIIWEKEPIKLEVIRGRAKAPFTVEEKYQFVRALLGLPELFDYPKGRDTGKAFVFDLAKDEKVERFRSPLTFKVFEHTLYLIACPIPDEMFSRTFVISKEKDHEHAVKKIFIPTPAKSSFTWEDFLNMPENSTWKGLNIQSKSSAGGKKVEELDAPDDDDEWMQFLKRRNI